MRADTFTLLGTDAYHQELTRMSYSIVNYLITYANEDVHPLDDPNFADTIKQSVDVLVLMFNKERNQVDKDIAEIINSVDMRAWKQTEAQQKARPH